MGSGSVFLLIQLFGELWPFDLLIVGPGAAPCSSCKNKNNQNKLMMIFLRFESYRLEGLQM